MEVLDHNDTLYNSTTSKSEDISDGIEIWTYILIALSCFALGCNFWMFVRIRPVLSWEFKLKLMSLTHNSLSYELSLTHFWSNELWVELTHIFRHELEFSTHFQLTFQLFFLPNTGKKIILIFQIFQCLRQKWPKLDL